MGSGPYKLVNTSTTEADYERFDGYWDKSRGTGCQDRDAGPPRHLRA